ncbi:ribosome maturation factor RimM [Paraburkholderia rhizosphaerae]|uniref:Ribosome maturation factor RimM n=1 Tax=Paraburkholderia rhizosphaerae TaxID=480658 RepID=A0A4R8LPQ0_9BURK|nr:ribosome maturation factor RimM [Paraburkholderia rhizosphaerae]TDY47820.1 16S rRNA processing protein RimM [Paraburkholderia rhizosphaerae]
MSARDSDSSSRAKAASGASFGVFARKPGARSAAASEAQQQATQAQVVQVQVIQDESAESWPDDAVEVGAIVDAYGLKGWVKVAAHSSAGQGGDALLSAKRWWLLKTPPRGQQQAYERKSAPVGQAKVHADSVVAQLGGVAGRDAALLLRGYRVYVGRSDFPALAADEYYWVDLLGLDVVNEAGVELGKVADMIDNGAQSVLRIEYPATGKDGKPVTGERLIPFVGVYVKTVDQAAKRIIVDWEADY